MQEIVHEVNVTRDLFNLEIEVKMGGEVMLREKANSLTENFLVPFYGFMGMQRLVNNIQGVYTTRQGSNHGVPPHDTNYQNTIIDGHTTPHYSVEMAGALAITNNANAGVWISGIRTPKKVNGFWPIESTSNGGKNIHLSGATPSVVGTSAYVDGDTTSYLIGFYGDVAGVGDGFPTNTDWRYPSIVVGAGTQAVTKLDWGMGNYLYPGSATGQLEYENMIISIPAIAGNTSTLTLTRDLTNNSGATVTVNEVGLMLNVWKDVGRYGSTNASALAARDLTTFTIPNGSTIEVSYRFNTHAAVTGGFLRQMNELLYRQLAQLSREAKDIFNNDLTVGVTVSQFRVAVGGASNYHGFDPNTTDSIPQQYSGVQIGLASTPVDIANFGLSNRIIHGSGADEFFYYGTIVDNWLSNTTTNQFDVIGMFENQSGATVDILETGLATTNSGSTVMNGYMLARHALAAAVSVPDGDCAKVTYRFSV